MGKNSLNFKEYSQELTDFQIDILDDLIDIDNKKVRLKELHNKMNAIKMSADFKVLKKLTKEFNQVKLDILNKIVDIEEIEEELSVSHKKIKKLELINSDDKKKQETLLLLFSKIFDWIEENRYLYQDLFFQTITSFNTSEFDLLEGWDSNSDQDFYESDIKEIYDKFNQENEDSSSDSETSDQEVFSY